MLMEATTRIELVYTVLQFSNLHTSQYLASSGNHI
jgi:hypothetical protein